MRMTLIYRRDNIKSVRDRHADQYRDWDDNRTFFDGTRIGDVRANLARLDLETCSLDDLGSVRSWAENYCDFCGGEYETLVRLGQEPDYESRWVDICRDDLHRAITLLDSSTPQATPMPPDAKKLKKSG